MICSKQTKNLIPFWHGDGNLSANCVVSRTDRCLLVPCASEDPFVSLVISVICFHWRAI